MTYELHNPAVARQRRYFNGPVIDFYIIQNENLLEGKPTTEQRKLYRETILFDTLGYTVELKDRKIEQRKSTSTFTDVQKWHTYLEELRETHFEPNGYEMPDTEQFWALEKKHGMQTAADITIHSLQRKLKQKLSPPKDKD